MEYHPIRRDALIHRHRPPRPSGMVGKAHARRCVRLVSFIPHPFAAAYGVGESWFRLLESVLLDYIPFIVLLFGLFVVAGGIAVRGTLAGTTKINCLLLFIGTFLASWIGTTGAAMLMIRPLIRANAWRKIKYTSWCFSFSSSPTWVAA